MGAMSASPAFVAWILMPVARVWNFSHGLILRATSKRYPRNFRCFRFHNPYGRFLRGLAGGLHHRLRHLRSSGNRRSTHLLQQVQAAAWAILPRISAPRRVRARYARRFQISFSSPRFYSRKDIFRTAQSGRELSSTRTSAWERILPDRVARGLSCASFLLRSKQARAPRGIRPPPLSLRCTRLGRRCRPQSSSEFRKPQHGRQGFSPALGARLASSKPIGYFLRSGRTARVAARPDSVPRGTLRWNCLRRRSMSARRYSGRGSVQPWPHPSSLESNRRASKSEKRCCAPSNRRNGSFRLYLVWAKCISPCAA